MTSKGLSPGNHVVEMLQNCILGTNECYQGIAREIINESEDVAGLQMRFDRHRSNHISVDQGQWSGSLFIQRSIGAIMHLFQSTSFARSKGRWHSNSGHT